MLNVGGVQRLQHGGIQQAVLSQRLAVHRILLQYVYDRSEKLVHALPVAAAAGVHLAVDEEHVDNEQLDAVVVVVGLVGQPPHVLLNLGADQLIMSEGIPWRLHASEEEQLLSTSAAYLGVIIQRVGADFCESLGVADKLEKVIPPFGICLPRVPQRLDPALGASLLKQ